MKNPDNADDAGLQAFLTEAQELVEGTGGGESRPLGVPDGIEGLRSIASSKIGERTTRHPRAPRPV